MKRFIVTRADRTVHKDKKYLVVNVDEPYAEKVFQMIRDNEKSKGTWDGPDDFEKFVQAI